MSYWLPADHTYSMKKPLIALLVLLAAPPPGGHAGDATDFINRLKAAPARVILAGNVPADPASVKVDRVWKGSVCRSRVRNTANTPIRVARVDLFYLEHGLPPNTPIYGEAFQMLGKRGEHLGTRRTGAVTPTVRTTNSKSRKGCARRTVYYCCIPQPAATSCWGFHPAAGSTGASPSMISGC